jgi:hypothetical protein
MLEKTEDQKAVHERIEELFIEIKNLSESQNEDQARDKLLQTLNIMKIEYNKLKNKKRCNTPTQ